MQLPFSKQIILIFLITVSIDLFAQSGSASIGDECPDVLLKHILHYKTSEAKISDFKGKLLILGFWATWCAPCLSMLPVEDSLQKKFADAIQILPVTYQDSSIVAVFMEKMYRVTHLLSPSVTGDTILSTIFGHTEIPHYVWIDEKSKVIAVTDAAKLTAETIENYLQQKEINAPVKEDILKVIDERKPMFVVGNVLHEGNTIHIEPIENQHLLYHSVITDYIEGFGCETGVDSTRITCKNNSIAGLYRIAAGHYELKKLLLNSTVWEVTNPVLREYSDSALLQLSHVSDLENWNKKFTYCYELKFPPALENKKFDIMLQDLNNYFGTLYNIQGRQERRKTKCLALRRTNQNAALLTKGQDDESVYNAFYLKLSNQPVYALINFLGYQMDLLPPLVDETGYNGKIDIELNCDLSDLQAVNRELEKYGLQLKEEKRERDMIVIKDKIAVK